MSLKSGRCIVILRGRGLIHDLKKKLVRQSTALNHRDAFLVSLPVGEQGSDLTLAILSRALSLFFKFDFECDRDNIADARIGLLSMLCDIECRILHLMRPLINL